MGSSLRQRIVVFVVLVLVTVSVRAQDPTESAKGASPTTQKTCFRVRDTRSLSAVDDRFVYVRCIRDRHYLLTMENACLGLENSIAVAVANRFDRVCSNDRAWITYKEFNQTRRCGILNVEEVADRNHALDVISDRKAVQKKKSEKETAAP